MLLLDIKECRNSCLYLFLRNRHHQERTALDLAPESEDGELDGDWDLLTISEHLALALWCGRWVDGSAPMGGWRWLHSHSKREKRDMLVASGRYFLKKSDVFGFLCWNFSTGPSVVLGIHFHQNSAAVLKTHRWTEQLLHSVLFPHFAISSWKYPSLRWMSNTSPWSFLESRVSPPEAEHLWDFQSCFKDQVKCNLSNLV